MTCASKFCVDALGNFRIVHVLGDLDLTSSALLEQTCRDASAGAGTIVLAFTECSFADSSCLSVVLRQARALGSRLRVVAPRANPVRRVFESTGLTHALHIYENFREALTERASIGLA